MRSFLPLILLVLASPALGEVVHLNDGTSVEGDLQRTSEGWQVTTADGKVTVVTASQIKSIEFKKSGPADTPEQKLASLRRAVANQSDLPRIIERYQSFILQNPDTPAAKDAQQDLATWQERLDKKMVKAGDQWLTKEQLLELQKKSMHIAETARAMIASGRVAEATPMIEKALAANPGDPSLLYLQGLIEYRQAHIVPARNAFQAAETAVPENGAVHNNIAVILWKQRAQMQALNEYAKAMLSLPNDQTILDNVYQALHTLPAEYKDKDLTKRVRETFAQQDSVLQKAMNARGLYRWGSEWLDQKNWDKVQAQQKAVQDKIDSLQRDFDGLQAAMLKIDRDIANDTQVMQAMASASVQQDPYSGRTYQLPLPQRYYDLQRDVANLKSQKVLDQKQIDDLRKFALQQKELMPQEKFTGLFKAYDVDGMPGATTSIATTVRPTTAPAATLVSGSPPAPAPAPAAPAASTGPASAPSSGGQDFDPPGRPAPGSRGF